MLIWRSNTVSRCDLGCLSPKIIIIIYRQLLTIFANNRPSQGTLKLRDGSLPAPLSRATHRHARHEGGVELPAEVGDVADGGVEDAGDEHELEDAEEADPPHVGGPHQVQVGVGVTAENTD